MVPRAPKRVELIFATSAPGIFVMDRPEGPRRILFIRFVVALP